MRAKEKSSLSLESEKKQLLKVVCGVSGYVDMGVHIRGRSRITSNFKDLQ